MSGAPPTPEPPLEGHVVLVPMKLDAFSINDATCTGNFKLAAIQQPEFIEPDVLQPIDISNANHENPRLHHPGTGEDIPSRRGVYLHWVLPQCYRHAATATREAMHDHTAEKLRQGIFDGKPAPTEGHEPESLKLSFRACPNRFMVVRNMVVKYKLDNAPGGSPGQPTTVEKMVLDCFAVESDRIRFIGDIPFDEDVEVESSPFIDPDVPLERQAEVFLGMKGWAEGWNEDEFALRHSPLTIMDCSNPYFADYQPQNAGVFSIHDDMSHHDGKKLWTDWVSATASYYVLGWQSDPELDPFHMHEATKDLEHPPTNEERLNDCFMKLASEPGTTYTKWLEGGVAGRTLCHGAIYGVKAVYSGERVGGTRIDQLQQSMIDSHPVAVGETALDALFAWLEVQQKDPAAPTTAPVQDILALRALLLAREEDPDSQAQAEDHLSFEHYLAESGESHFHFAAKDEKNPAVAAVAVEHGENKEKGPEVYMPSSAVLAELDELNNRQRLLDAGLRELHHLRWELFSEWWKAVTFKPRIGEAEDSLDTRRATIRTRVAEISQQLNALTSGAAGSGVGGSLSLSLVALADEIAGRKKRLEEEAEVQAAGMILQAGAGERFYLPKDPTVLVAGTPSGWPTDFDDPVRVRLDSQIYTEIGSDWTVPGGASTAPIFNETMFFNRLHSYAMYWWWFRGVEGAGQEVANMSRPGMVTYGPGNAPATPMTWVGIISSLRRSSGPVGRSLYIAGAISGGVYDNTSAAELGPRTFPAYAATLGDKLPGSLRQAAEKLLLYEFPFFQWARLQTAAENLPNFIKVPPAYLRDGDRWEEQPLCPLFIEWEVEYWHIDFEHWQFAAEGRDKPYRYLLKSDVPAAELRSDRRVLSGRSLVSAAAQMSLAKAVKELLDTSPVTTDPVLEKYQSEVAQAALLEAVASLEYFSSPLSGFRDQLITRLRDTHVKPSVLSHEGKVDKALLDGLAADFGIARGHLDMMDSASETTPFASTRNIPPSPPRPAGGGDDTAPCPFKPVTHGQFRFTKYHIVDKFGQVVTAPNPLHPCTSPQYSLNRLGSGAPNSMAGAPEHEEDEYVQIPPSINQAARWNSEFMIPGADGSWRPAGEFENPIWAWLVVDYTDMSLQIFRPDGRFLLEVGLRIGGKDQVVVRTNVPGFDPSIWTMAGPAPATGHPAAAAATDGIGAQLSDFLSHLVPSPSNPQPLLPFAIFFTMAQAMDKGSLAVPRDSLTDSLPISIGRPVALVNTGWSLELSLPPFENESTLVPGAPSPGHALLDYEFPLKLGDGDNRRDGVIGYFTQPDNSPSASHFDYATMHTYFIEEGDTEIPAAADPRVLISPSNLPRFRPYYAPPSRYQSAAEHTAARNAQLRVFPMLLDPFAPATAYSGILPPAPLSLPGFALERALRRLTASLRVGPTLLPVDLPEFRADKVPRERAPTVLPGGRNLGQGGQVAEVALPAGEGLPIPAMGGGGWAWMQPYPGPGGAAGPEVLWNEFAVSQGDVRPRMDERAVLCVVEGYLDLVRPLGAS